MALHSQIDGHKIHSGWLYKKGVFSTSWKKRYFVLYDDRTLDYFSKEIHSTTRSKAKGKIHLTQIKRVEFIHYMNNLLQSSTSQPNEFNFNHQYLDSANIKICQFHEFSLPKLKQYDGNLFPNVADCELTDHDNNSDQFGFIISPNDKYDTFHTILNHTKLGLKCDRRYSFALIHRQRQYILSAETNKLLKEWITILHELCQGNEIYSGYLRVITNENNKNNKEKKCYFVLYKNKVLNCYKNNNNKEIEFDIDLRHIIWLKCGGDCDNRYQFEIATPNHIFTLIASNKAIRNEWHNNIRGIPSKYNNNNINVRCITLVCGYLRNIEEFEYVVPLEILNIISASFCLFMSDVMYDSMVCNINFMHNGQNLKDRYVALFEEYLVIFKNKNELNNIKKMTFFNKIMFRDYMRCKHCVMIPLNHNVKIRKASKRNGNFAFCVYVRNQDRKWYFNLNDKHTLAQWFNYFQQMGSNYHVDKNNHKSDAYRT